MIRFSLKCASEHAFDSWFQSGAAYEALRTQGHLACPVCGSTAIDKDLMAPSVQAQRPPAASPAPAPASANLSKPDSQVAQAVAALRAQIEANSDYVGLNFVSEARKMHLGELPERPIYGEARPDEARKLLEDGVPVAPLPFLPKRKAN